MHRYWKTSELNFIRTNLHLTDKELGKKLGVSGDRVKSARARYQILKGRGAGQFKKGMRPFNAGMPGHLWIRPEQLVNVQRTQFKKGQKPVNHNRIMFSVFDVDGHKFIKLPHKRAYPLNRYVWEQNTGEVLTGNDVITYKDGNPHNCEFTNLVKISRAENMKRNANRKKQGEGMRWAWMIHKTFRAYGADSRYKWKAA